MTSRKRKSGDLDAADRNALPDSAYAFPAKRKEPLTDASHVRNAIARFDQVEDVTDEERREAFTRIQRAAKRYDVQLSETRWQDLGKPRRSTAPGANTRRTEPSRDSLYAEAQRRGIKGRSSMTKDQLARALGD